MPLSKKSSDCVPVVIREGDSGGKSDRLAALRATRQRAEAKAQHRRDLYKASLDVVTAEESIALRKKHDLPLDGSSSEFRLN